MNVTVKYFGMLNSITAKEIETINVYDSISLSGFKKIIIMKYPELVETVFQIAVNMEIENENVLLKENDELAFLPPYSGG